MTTLTAAPLAPLLDRLFEEADAAEPDDRTPHSPISPTRSRRACCGARPTMANFYGRMKNLPLAVSRETGALLYMLARSSGARTIVEFGTSFGISTLHLAAALRDNGGGRLITSEFEPSKAARAKANLKAGGVIDLVEIREGDALETLSVDLPETIDLVLLDGAKSLYPEILSLLESRLKPGALDRRRQRGHEPRLPQARARAGKRLHVRALRRGRRAVDAIGCTDRHVAGPAFAGPRTPVRACEGKAPVASPVQRPWNVLRDAPSALLWTRSVPQSGRV